MITPVIRRLKADGYHVTLNCTERVEEVLRHNPHVDAFLLQKTNEIPLDRLPEHWASLKVGFDKWVNLSGSIEGALLRTPAQADYTAPRWAREATCNKNYMDHTMTLAGYPEATGELPELHFKAPEERWAKGMMRGFTVLVSLSGSSLHKIYPHMGSVVGAIHDGIPESQVLLVGEPGCRGIIDEEDRVIDLCGKIGIRKSFALAKYASLVISTETSVANAASAFETPKVVLLSHSSEENLTKYWKNCIAIKNPVSCYPCHKLHYSKDSCPVEEQTQLPLCSATLHPKHVVNAVETFYRRWALKEVAA